MRLEIANVELVVNRRGFFMETGAFAVYWDFTVRPIFSRKTA